MTDANQSFCRSALDDLKKRAQEEASKLPALHHMLVLPAGEQFEIPSSRCHPLAHRTVPRISTFAGTKIGTFLPPETCWPVGLPPATAVAADPEITPYKPAREEPYRVHLFFGDRSALSTLRTFAANVLTLRNDLIAAITKRKVSEPVAVDMHDVLYESRDCIHGKEATDLDAWLCTIHWWAWKATDSPIRVKPKVVFGVMAIEAAFTDPSVAEKLSFSYLPVDVFAASAATIDLLIRFLDQPPSFYFRDTYPPRASPVATSSPSPSEEPADYYRSPRQNESAAVSGSLLKEPPADAFTAYRLFLITGKKQKELADQLSHDLGRTISQGQVSRWLSQATEWIKAGNVLPDLQSPSEKPITVDPEVLEMGERRDRLTRRQRSRPSDPDE